jgi:hypothetical protein
MTVSEFRIVLRELPAGQAAHVPYEVFAELFPPGEPDDDARERAYRFAKENGCIIDNRPASGEVLFAKR